MRMSQGKSETSYSPKQQKALLILRGRAPHTSAELLRGLGLVWQLEISACPSSCPSEKAAASGNSSSWTALPWAPCLLPSLKCSVDCEGLKKHSGPTVSHRDHSDSRSKSQGHRQQWETHPATPNHTAMACYLCVGHLIQILIGHVNHEGVNPCKRGKGGKTGRKNH